MAIFHFDIRPVKRSAGQQATGAAAYRAGEAIRDERTGDLHNHSRRQDVRHKEIFLPSKLGDAPLEWARNRATLWNAAEAAEKRRNSRVAREYEMSLPPELNSDQRLALARSFSRELADRYGVAVDLAIHDPKPDRDSPNFHAHLLTTTREITPTGLGEKTGLDMGGVSRAKQGLASHSEEYYVLRERWAALTNQALREANVEARVDHRSLAAQGIDRKPVLHIPYEFYQLERQGVPKEVAERLREDYRARLAAHLERSAGAKGVEHASPQPDLTVTKESITAITADRTAAQASQVAAPADRTAAQASQVAAPADRAAAQASQIAAPAHRTAAQASQAATAADRTAAQASQAATPAAGATAPVAHPTPEPEGTLVPRNTEEIRRRAVQAWLRMRSKEVESSVENDNANDAPAREDTDKGRGR